MKKSEATEARPSEAHRYLVRRKATWRDLVAAGVAAAGVAAVTFYVARILLERDEVWSGGERAITGGTQKALGPGDEED